MQDFEQKIALNPEKHGIATSTQDILGIITSQKDLQIYTEKCDTLCKQKEIVQTLVQPEDLKVSDFAYYAYIDTYETGSIAQPYTQNSLLGVENKIFVSEIEPEQIEIISTELGEYLVQKIYPELHDNRISQLEFVSKASYLEIRNKKLDDYIEYLNGQLTLVNQYIAQGEAYLAEDRYYQQLYGQYGDEGWGHLVNLDIQYLSELNAIKENILNLIASTEQEKNEDASEWGVYLPPNEIYIISQNEFDYTSTEYIHILIHEYLHFKSDSADTTNSDFPEFFEEGLTEFFTLRAMQNAGTSIFYTDAVRIIKEMTKKISIDEFWSIYRTKDTSQLKEVLDSTYGEGFYDNNQENFNDIIKGDFYSDAFDEVMLEIQK